VYDPATKKWESRTPMCLHATIVEGAAKRLRPKFMTVATMFVGLIPIMWATGTGFDVWKRIAAPMIGGIFTSFVLELVVYSAIYEIWKWLRDEVRSCRARRAAVARGGTVTPIDTRRSRPGPQVSHR
jgi:Cu(I)/Ag(I) efflux system membrane protein CusA/SilA